MTETTLKRLSQVRQGKTVVLVRVDAGCGLNNRLAAMGLLPRTQIKVVNNHHHGPFVLDLKGAKMALGRGMANKILVQEI
ncbi:MAG: FeoA family protein [Phycisphaerae bacterium]|jgi:Fe2+ transport system protein FeoA